MGRDRSLNSNLFVIVLYHRDRLPTSPISFQGCPNLKLFDALLESLEQLLETCAKVNKRVTVSHRGTAFVSLFGNLI